MGRRTGNTENTKAKTTEEVVEEVVEKKATTKKVDAKAEARKKAREKKKLFTDDLEISMFCNVGNSECVYQDKKNNVYKTMRFGDTEYFTFKELKEMRTRQGGFLTKYILIPYDVYSDDLTIEDVVEELGIAKLYEDDMLYAESIDELLLEVDYNTFTRTIDNLIACKSNKTEKGKVNYFNRILDRAIELAGEGEFNDIRRQVYLREIIGKSEPEDDIFAQAFKRNMED